MENGDAKPRSKRAVGHGKPDRQVEGVAPTARAGVEGERSGYAIGEGPVVITGICGRLGKGVARVLHRERPVIGVDRRPFSDKPKDIEHRQIDVRRKKLKDVFRPGDVQAVVHLGVMHDPRASAAEHHSWNVAAFAKLLEYVAQFRVPKLVVLSSANVYWPAAGQSCSSSREESPLLGGAAFSEIRDLIEVDMLAQSFFWKHPEAETVILRPVHILGRVRNAASNYLRLDAVPTLLGFDPMVQVIHESDVVRAIQLALRPSVRGIFNVAGGRDPLPLSAAHHQARSGGRISRSPTRWPRSSSAGCGRFASPTFPFPSSTTSATCAWWTTPAPARSSASRRRWPSRRRSGRSTPTDGERRSRSRPRRSGRPADVVAGRNPPRRRPRRAARAPASRRDDRLEEPQDVLGDGEEARSNTRRTPPLEERGPDGLAPLHEEQIRLREPREESPGLARDERERHTRDRSSW